MATETVERWGIFELSLEGSSAGNPFLDANFSAKFTCGGRAVEAEGFYDGGGVYRARFMPDEIGEWRYQTKSNQPELDGKTGVFSCVAPAPGNHGPVRVADTFHFAYADGTRYLPIGTTCYAWVHQGDDLEEATLKTLSTAPFNKLRMCVFPKDYTYCKTEPERHPFEKLSGGGWDFTRFNPAFFQHIEGRIQNLQRLGIEADLILFHPYDRWGYANMDAATDDRYLRYAVARFAAHRNVWWSLANEFDCMKQKTMDDWDRFFQIIQRCDPHQHLRSIHNNGAFYDHGKPWVTHVSVQKSEVELVREWRRRYKKPVIVDECCYEGNIEEGWGNIPAHELVHRCWVGALCGGYVGHGETYRHPQDILWWSKGGVLHGKSAPCIAFLRKVLEEAGGGLTPTEDFGFYGSKAGDDYILLYFGVRQPAVFSYTLPNAQPYQIDVIDPWEMTITPKGRFSGSVRIELPGKPYLAIRMKNTDDRENAW